MGVSWVLFSCLLLCVATTGHGRISFEKVTDLDYKGRTYYTIRNLTLYECQGWCREEPDCAAAAFSFVVNPLAPVQETVCLLQNETAASDPSASPQKTIATYYMTKLNIRSDNVCNRPWTFERVPNKMLRGFDNALIFTSTKESCLATCLNERRFVCRSVEYNYVTLQCHLSEHDRRSVDQFTELADAQGVDYFENLCLRSSDACAKSRVFTPPQIGVADDRIAQHVDVHFYVDKELLASSQGACERACQVENEFLCRSYLFKDSVPAGEYNCFLYHLDHKTLPEGPSTFLSTDRPLLDNGEPSGRYFEATCEVPEQNGGSSSEEPFNGSTSSSSSGSTGSSSINSGSFGSSSSSTGNNGNGNGPNNSGTNSGGSFGSSSSSTGNNGNGNGPNNSGINNGGSGSTSNNQGSFSGSSARPIVAPPTVVATTATPGSSTVQLSNNNNNNGGSNNIQQDDINCDRTGTCFDVAVNCRDTKIEVQVQTNRLFNGRVYALGRSETCNVEIVNSNLFRLDLSMFGQDCNTQSVNGVFTNTIVLQHHSVVMTKGDKIYKIKCTYDTTPKNVTFGLMPIRDPDMISITSAPEAPPPRIRILDNTGKDVESVRIGDRLTFRVEIPGETPYGIFARSCVAMAKDSRSVFEIIDENGCPVDPSIFPRFTPEGTALQSNYEAFRFTESYGVIFQCNVRYCLGPCEPAKCQWGRETIESWGRKRRSTEDSTSEEEMNISQEILVFDAAEEEPADLVEPKLDAHLYSDMKLNNATHSIFEEAIHIYNTSCPTKTSVIALSITCALLAAIYVCSLIYFLMRRWMNQAKHF